MKKTHGVILLNVGTPQQYNYWAVKAYLDQFLMDKRIIDIPYIWRLILVKFIITPFRAQQSAKKYLEIWQKDGSPLYSISLKQTEIIKQKLGPDFITVLAMRYGKPSIKSQVKYLLDQGCDHLILVPLFPQYSSAASGSALEEALRCINSYSHIPTIKTLAPFYKENYFIEPQADNIAASLSKHQHLIMSFHGLPLQHIKKNHRGLICHHQQACPTNESLYFCYRAQCYETARNIANRLLLKEEQYSVCFQSRLGKQPWIRPSLEETLISLRQKDIVDVMVASPSFVSDCLETLHEIGIEAKTTWQNLSGKNMQLIPCLNLSEKWLSGLCQKIKILADG